MPELRKMPSNPLGQILWLLLQGACIWAWISFDVSQPREQQVQLGIPVILGLATGALLTGLITLLLRGLKALWHRGSQRVGGRPRQAHHRRALE